MKRLVLITFCLCIAANTGAHDSERESSTRLAAAHSHPATNRPPAEVGAKTLAAILFRTDSAAVEQALWPVLRGIAALASAHPRLIIELAGHTDVRGSRNHNRVLSSRRVGSVAAFLVRSGVSPDRIRIHAYGESRASANVNDASGRLFDRRVTITLRRPDVAA